MKKFEFFLITFLFASIIGGITSGFTTPNLTESKSNLAVLEAKTEKSQLIDKNQLEDVERYTLVDMEKLKKAENPTTQDFLFTLKEALGAFFATIIYALIRILFPSFLKPKTIKIDVSTVDK